MKWLCLISVLAILLVALLAGDQEILIESWESKTTEGNSVFNRIKWFSLPEKDVWMMNQSHHGANSKAWDRLAIVVDKKTKTAKFYQLESGPLEWSEDLAKKSTPFRVACFLCHNNGPRAIRPQHDSAFALLALREQLKLAYWNLRIKTYGRITESPEHALLDETQRPPFRFRGVYENETLKVKTCVNCHQENGLFARGALHRQQLGTIRFLVENKQMPPPGFSLSEDEKRELTRFLKGF